MILVGHLSILTGFCAVISPAVHTSFLPSPHAQYNKLFKTLLTKMFADYDIRKKQIEERDQMERYKDTCLCSYS